MAHLRVARRGVSRLLLAAVAVESAFAAALGGNAIRQLTAGNARWPIVTAVCGLVWVLVVSAAVVRAVRQLSRRVADQDEHLAALASTSAEWAWQSGTDLVLTQSSGAVEPLLGYQADELLGRSLTQLVAGVDRSRLARQLDSCLRSKRGWTDLELTWRRTDRNRVRLRGSAVPVLDRAGRLTGFRGTWRATPAIDVADHRLARIWARVYRTLKHAEFKVALQPIVRLDTGQWVGAEALIRFRDGRSPATWLAEAYEAGLGVELELAALRQAFTLATQLPDHVYLAVNASPALLANPEFAETLYSSGIPLQRIVVEITEHTAITSYDDVRETLMPLRERGLGLAVDDTGAGYASFHHVLCLHPDHIKLDRSLVTGLPGDPARRALVTAIVLLALELEASVTAEGIETADELAALAALGVDHAQGFFLARPTTDPERWRRWATRSWGRSFNPAADRGGRRPLPDGRHD